MDVLPNGEVPNESGIPNYYLTLSEPLMFEAVSRARLNNVFFDEGNIQVFCVHSGEKTEVVAKSPDQSSTLTFQIEEKGPIISIKFNPDQNVLAVQRTHSSVEFINFTGGLLSPEYSQSCKSKSAKILGFTWASATEIMFVTDQGVELYVVESVKKQVKMSKSLAMNVNWFLYCHRSSILLLSSGTLGNSLQPIYLKQGNLHKLSRFEIEPASSVRSQKLCVEERDVMVAMVYGLPRIVVLRHQSKTVHQRPEVIVYTIKRMSVVKKTDVLKLSKDGRFAMSVVDNMIIVHHQGAKDSIMYDIELETDSDGSVLYHCPSMPIKPIMGDSEIELYSSNWIMFPPNIIIDITVGRLWHLELELGYLNNLHPGKSFLIEFLMLRHNSKEAMLQVLRQVTQNPKTNLELLEEIFNKLNKVYRTYLMESVKWQLGSPVSAGEQLPLESPTINRVVISQSDMYSHVLSRLADNVDESSFPRRRKFAIWVLLQYVRSLTDQQIPIQHYLLELVINSLVLHKAYYQLHQLLQYFVVTDSKPLACLLLSLENLYPASHQVALDMLNRLPTAKQDIAEVLLSKKQIIPALRFTIDTCPEDQLSPRKFSELAKATNDKLVVYGVNKYLANRTTTATTTSCSPLASTSASSSASTNR